MIKYIVFIILLAIVIFVMWCILEAPYEQTTSKAELDDIARHQMKEQGMSEEEIDNILMP